MRLGPSVETLERRIDRHAPAEDAVETALSPRALEAKQAVTGVDAASLQPSPRSKLAVDGCKTQ
jgi:hypothetical protein